MKFLIVILVILLLAMAAAVSFDVVPYMMNIYLRMKMGSAGVGESWLEAAQSIVCKWLGKGVPTVPRVAGRRLSIIPGKRAHCCLPQTNSVRQSVRRLFISV